MLRKQQNEKSKKEEEYSSKREHKVYKSKIKQNI